MSSSLPIPNKCLGFFSSRSGSVKEIISLFVFLLMPKSPPMPNPSKPREFINSLGFDGFGIGGGLGISKKTNKDIISLTLPLLDEKKPRHLLGIGKLEDIEPIIKSGIDTFDCTVPTHYARSGVAFTSSGPLNLRQSKFLKDKKPIDANCACFVCEKYARNYISHMLRAKEITPLRLLTFHNLFYFNGFVRKIRLKIKNGIL